MPVVFSHPSSLLHETGMGHPERVDRMHAILAELERRDWLGFERREAPRASEEQLLAVHTAEHVAAVRETSARAGAFDLDTPTSEGSWDAALHGAGGACALVEALTNGGHLAVLSALALAQPIFDILGRNPTFFAARGSSEHASCGSRVRGAPAGAARPLRGLR